MKPERFEIPGTKGVLVLEVRMAWWWWAYMTVLIFLCRGIGVEPNMENVGYWCRKALRVRIANPGTRFPWLTSERFERLLREV